MQVLRPPAQFRGISLLLANPLSETCAPLTCKHCPQSLKGAVPAQSGKLVEPETAQPVLPDPFHPTTHPTRLAPASAPGASSRADSCGTSLRFTRDRKAGFLAPLP